MVSPGLMIVTSPLQMRVSSDYQFVAADDLVMETYTLAQVI
jgi:hypothetical protein